MRGRSPLSVLRGASGQTIAGATLAACLALGYGSHAAAQQTNPGPLAANDAAAQTTTASAGPIPEVRLETHDGKTKFMLGERIQLDLVFRNTTGDAYTVNTTVYGDLSERKVEITPATGWLQWQGPSAHDYSAVAQLDAHEQRIPVVLNQGFVFREPGHYEIRVTTGRLSRGIGLQITPVGLVTTNSVAIDLVPMPQEVEAATVGSLMAEIASSAPYTPEAGREHAEAYERLASLQGDDALRAKIKLILDEDDEMRQVASEALASTSNLPLQLSLLEAAWKDPSHAPPYDLAGELEMTRQLMRRETMSGWTMIALPKDDEATRTAARERAGDVAALIASLPARSGENRAHTLYLLYDTMQLTPEQKVALAPAVVEAFPYMDSTEQAMLLETAHPPLRDAAMVPALRAMLDRDAIDQDAIGPLIELDPKGAKPYVVRAICEAKFIIPLDKVAKLPDASLPEVDGCLSELLRKPPAQPRDQFVWNTRAMLAARFATTAVVPAVREGWKDKSQDGAALAVLLRLEPAEAVAYMKAHDVLDLNTFLSLQTVYKASSATFPPELRAWLRDKVENGSDQVTGSSAYYLSQAGSREDRAAIEARLKQGWAEWAASPTTDAEVAKHRADSEAGLFSALRMAHAWYMTNAEAADLARGCISDQCRNYAKPRVPDAPFPE